MVFLAFAKSISSAGAPLFRSVPRVVTRKPTWPSRLAPGIYEAAPCTGFVIVPKAHLDERAIIQPGGQAFSAEAVRPGMPALEPPLWLIPRSRVS